MEVLQISSKELISYTAKQEKSKRHGKHKENYFTSYYSKNKQKYLLANQKYRTKLKSNNPPKPTSFFLKTRQNNLLSCLNKHHITVPVPRFLKIKHPIIKNWNSPNWWSKENIFELLKRGWNYFTLLNKDNSYRGVRVGCIDIDEAGWTKIPTKYWTCYISAGNGKIKVLFLYKDNQGLKTGKGYFQGEAILDFKISGGIMGIGSIHPNGKPYVLKGAGSFFLQGNRVFNSPKEVIELLKQDWDIEISSIKQNLLKTERERITENDYNTKQEIFAISVKDPPWQKVIITREYNLKIGNN